MKKKCMIIVILLALTSVIFARNTHVPKYDYEPGKVVVKTANNQIEVAGLESLSGVIRNSKGIAEPIKKVFDSKKIKSLSTANSIGLFRIYTVQIDESIDVMDLCRELNLDKSVEWAEPVYIIPQDVVPNDPMWDDLTHHVQLQSAQAWDVVKGDNSIPIAIIDSGIDWKHPDLQDIIWINPGEDINNDGVITAADSNGVDDDSNGFIDDFIGWDFVDDIDDPAEIEDGDEEDNDPMDVNGHGTHCAGLAAGINNNNEGIAGASWGCTIMPVRIGWLDVNGDGFGKNVDMARGYIYAADNGAKVANLSYGTSAVVTEGARYAYLKDVCVLTSAGNDDVDTFDSMNLEPWCISVGSVDPYDVKALYSNYGVGITVCAPGGDHNPGLWSTTPNNAPNNNSYYNAYSGTSMAAPVAAGVLGLIRSQHTDWTASQAYFQLIGTADDIDDLNPGYEGQLGAGRINSYRAVTETVIPKPELALKYIEFKDPTGNNNNLVDPGEDINLIFHIENRWATVADVTMKIESDDSRITISTNSTQLDTVFGIEKYPYDNTNVDVPLVIQIADNLPPGNIPINLILQNSAFSDTFKVDVPIHTLILFVDEGTEVPVDDYYKQAFDELSLAYSHWVNTEEIDSAYINQFPIVVWACEWTFPSINEYDRNLISDYLENGGNLFVSGQDIGWDLCDETVTNNEWFKSSGASKAWYETYLSSVYIGDDVGISTMAASDNQLFDLPPFEFYQPERVADQYPSELSPTDNGYSVLNYTNETSGAVASDAPYSTVYFAFGGYEAITDTEIRIDVMKQIINHFSQIDLSVTELRNTEYTGPFTVNAVPATDKTIDISQLWYQVNDEHWQSVDMVDDGNGKYSASIPQISVASADINYFVFFKHDDGTYYAGEKLKFYSGPDTEPPVVTGLHLPINTIDRLGPYYTSFSINDNVSVDTANVLLFYKTSAGTEESVALSFLENDIWEGTFEFTESVADGDSVNYYIIVSDNGATTNSTRYPETGYFTFNITQQVMLENFEGLLSNWTNDNDFWSIYIDPNFAFEGQQCLISGDGVNYSPDQDASLTLNSTINFKSRERGVIKFMAVQWLENDGDTAYFEIKQGDEGDWIPLHKFSGTAFVNWTEYVFDMTDYCGDGNDPLSIRFRFLSDSETSTRVGLLVDKIEVFADDAVAIDNQYEQFPVEFSLHQNYPNPFNPTTTIKYSIAKKCHVKLTIYDITGREIKTLYNDIAAPGYKTVSWNGTSNDGKMVPSGFYIYKISSDHYNSSRKMLFLK